MEERRIPIARIRQRQGVPPHSPPFPAPVSTVEGTSLSPSDSLLQSSVPARPRAGLCQSPPWWPVARASGRSTDPWGVPPHAGRPSPPISPADNVDREDRQWPVTVAMGDDHATTRWRRR